MCKRYSETVCIKQRWQFLSHTLQSAPLPACSTSSHHTLDEPSSTRVMKTCIGHRLGSLALRERQAAGTMCLLFKHYKDMECICRHLPMKQGVQGVLTQCTPSWPSPCPFLQQAFNTSAKMSLHPQRIDHYGPLGCCRGHDALPFKTLGVCWGMSL